MLTPIANTTCKKGKNKRNHDLVTGPTVYGPGVFLSRSPGNSGGRHWYRGRKRNNEGETELKKLSQREINNRNGQEK